MDMLGDTYVRRIENVDIPRRSSTGHGGHTLPIYVGDGLFEERKSGNEGVYIIQTFVVCNEQPQYENPLVPHNCQNSSACGKAISHITKETTSYPQFLQYSTRLATFGHDFFTNNQTLAKLGFFYKGQADTLCCYECGVTLSQWSKDDDPLIEHVRYSPECRYLSTVIDSTTLKDYKSQLQIIRAKESTQGAEGVRLVVSSSHEERTKIRSPEYLSYSVRLSTFARFPAILGLDVNQIAAAGFYYTGQQDIVRCYACDGGLRQWVPGDDPWEEHYKWFPDCYHLEQSNYQTPEKTKKAKIGGIAPEEKSAASVGNASHSEGLDQRLKELTFKEQEPKQQEVDLDLNTPAALAVLDFGYSRNATRMAISELRKKGVTKFTADGILHVLVSLEDRGVSLPTDHDFKENDSKKNALPDFEKVSTKANKTVTSEMRDKEICYLQEENEKLTKQMMCKRCKAKQRNILVLPCTHFCLCEKCSIEVSLCPECWKPIKERVKTYIP